MLVQRPNNLSSIIESALCEIKDHNSRYELARFSKIPLKAVRELISVLPENTCIRFTNNYFESYAQIIYLNGLCYYLDMTLFPSKDSLEEWTWCEDNDSSISGIIDFLKNEELEIERNTCPDTELEDLSDYKWITEEWTVHIDSSYFNTLDEAFFSASNPEHEDSDPDLISFPAYPRSEPSKLSIPDIARKLYQ